jgi:hypothetical protein
MAVMAREWSRVRLRAVTVIGLAMALLLTGCLSDGGSEKRNGLTDREAVADENGEDRAGPVDLGGDTAVREEVGEAAVDGESPVGGGDRPDAGDRLKLNEAELMAELERSFDAYDRIELRTGEHLDASLVMLDDHRLVYIAHTEAEGSDGRIYSSSIRLLDLASGKTTVLVTDLPYQIVSLAYRSDEEVLEADYYDYELNMWQYASWALSGSQAAAAKPRWTLTDNGRWTLFRSNDAPGIWAVDKRRGKPVRLSEYDMDQRPIWFPGEDRFLYLAHTGNLLADGSGFEYVLAEHDLAKGTSRVLPYEAGVWHLIGWAEPGKSVLVDHAFNEGESVAYTEPRLLDIKTMAETRLADQALRSYNRAYSEALGKLTVQIPGYFIHYDSLGKIREVSPWAYEGGEIDEVWPQSFSPNGSAWAYVTDNGEGSGVNHSFILADASGMKRSHLLGADEYVAPLAWSPDGASFAVLARVEDHLYVGVQRVRTAMEPRG